MKTSVIHTSDLKMKKLLSTVESVAGSRASVLIQGESGTGKELLARYLHSKSARANKAFVAVNCAAIPAELLESELFGYEKGAFTGATHASEGKFQKANGGTFLLDEIGEMPLHLQSKILRVLQEGEIERLGGSQVIPVDVRFVAATNRDLQSLVEAGQFREDLFYRLNVIPLVVPPLRDRVKDIGLLADLFIESSCAQNDIPIKKITPEAQKVLLNHDWPGNVRELQNVVERAVLLSGSSEITPKNIDIDSKSKKREPSLSPGMTVSEAERCLILKTLEFTNQNRTHAADLLGISIRTLRNKINEYKSENRL